MTEEEFYRLKDSYNDFMMKVWSKAERYCAEVEGIPSCWLAYIFDISAEEIVLSGSDLQGDYIGIVMPIDIMWDTENVIAREKEKKRLEDEAEKTKWRWP